MNGYTHKKQIQYLVCLFRWMHHAVTPPNSEARLGVSINVIKHFYQWQFDICGSHL